MNKYLKWITLSFVLLMGFLIGGSMLVSLGRGASRSMGDYIHYEKDGVGPTDLSIFRSLLGRLYDVREVDSDLLEVGYDSLENTTLVYTNANILFTRNELTELGYLLEQGASVVIATANFRKFAHADTLLDIHQAFYNRHDDSLFRSPSFADFPEMPPLEIQQFRHLIGVDDSWEVLLESHTESIGDEVHTLAVRKKVGLGYLYVFDSPALFTNEVMANDELVDIPFMLLRDCDFSTTYFVNYTEPHQTLPQKSNWSALGWILSNPSLATAFWLLMFTMFVVYVGKARRKQQIIPIQEPMLNHSVDFNNQVATLYIEKENHAHVLEKAVEDCFRTLRELRNVDVNINTEHLEQKLQEEAMLPSDLAARLASLALVLDRNIEINDQEFIQHCHTLREVHEILG